MDHDKMLQAFKKAGYVFHASHLIWENGVPYQRFVGSTLTPTMKETLKKELGSRITFEDGPSIMATGTVIIG